jgi:5-methylcytosine-specific restriction endonuclease McrA
MGTPGLVHGRPRSQQPPTTPGAVVSIPMPEERSPSPADLSIERRRERGRLHDRKRAQDPDFRARRAEYLRAYRTRPECMEKDRARRRVENMSSEAAQRRRERDRRWIEANPEKRGRKLGSKYVEDREVKASRRARGKAAKRGATVERVHRSKVWERDSGICHICRQSADPQAWDLEHVIPISKGGMHAYSNVRVSHPSCNRQKWDSDPREPGSPYAYLLEACSDAESDCDPGP